MNRKHVVVASHLAFSLGGLSVGDSSGTRSIGNRALQKKKTEFNVFFKIWEQFSSPHLKHPLLRLYHSGKKQKKQTEAMVRLGRMGLYVMNPAVKS